MTSLREEDGHETARKEKCTAPARMPWVSPQNCEGCGQCVTRCPRGILSMTETNVADVYVPWMKQVDKCLGCGLCADACVMGGIVMTAYVEMAKKRFLTKRPTVYQD